MKSKEALFSRGLGGTGDEQSWHDIKIGGCCRRDGIRSISARKRTVTQMVPDLGWLDLILFFNLIMV